ncbi:hypothetical protein [Sphingopyxis flava]|uniref:Uncharacterized protein n=1 Tax=Sphingopyxis flava TaxID=1507287 RepID=A0A1T5AC49_9SPHN|nr:hypothetical protein [Sphingopyxis flava]SKB32534.1 hypothetical protein SAMN06295937_100388 [Sphingopyxis flava]
MRSFSFRVLIVSAVFAVAASFTEHIVAPIERAAARFFEFVASVFKVEPMRLAADGPSLVLREDRDPLPASLLERLRHEKGVPRLGAARGC